MRLGNQFTFGISLSSRQTTFCPLIPSRFRTFEIMRKAIYAHKLLKCDAI
jgi:hypothetical protein